MRAAHTLPAATSAFVGRSRDLSELGRLLEGHRLVTVTGVGGVGKTRLALEAVRRWGAHRPAFLVELESLQDDRQVEGAIAEAVGVAERSRGQLLRAAAARLGGSVLLVIDNCEHVIGGAGAAIAELLKLCSDLHILATSRRALELSGEGLLPLAPLSVKEAARLFSIRALSADPDFESEPQVVERLCQGLDCLPLAIELAAARSRLLSPSQMLERLEDRFSLLKSSAPIRGARQQTLEATIDWSHQLLDADEAILFRRLAVFSGGFTLEAAEAVCGFEPLKSGDVLDQLGGLVNSSLVVASQVGQAKRYGLWRSCAHTLWTDSLQQARWTTCGTAMPGITPAGRRRPDRASWWVRTRSNGSTPCVLS
jgi:predicted ATPase